jgi:IS5 family transposase
VQDAKNEKARRKPYRKLIALCERTVGYAQEAAEALHGVASCDVLGGLGAQARAEEIEDYMVGGLGVIHQTWRRVINGEQVPAGEKIVSIFEPHTDIIVKDRRGTQYGHKVFLSTGASGIITDCRVLEGNPADCTLLGQALERHKAVFGRYPRQAAFDGGFASKANLRLAKSKDGVEDVAFAKKRGLDPLEMTKSLWVYRRLRNFRAGVEGCISALKRICGLRVCDWKGWHGFQRYVYSAVVAFNLLVMARRLLC